MSREFLIATWRKSGFVGGVLLRSAPANMGKLTSAVLPGARSGTCKAWPGPKPNGFLLTWMAKPVNGTADAFEKVSCSWSPPSLRTRAAMTPKPLFPPCPGCEEVRTAIFGGGPGAGEAMGSSLPPPRSSKSRSPPPELFAWPFPLAGPEPGRSPLSISCCTSRRRSVRSISSYSSSWMSASCSGTTVVMRVTNSSAGLWYTLLISARSAMSLSSKPFSICWESSRIVGLSPSTTCFVDSGFVDSSRQ
mmetsp:Transcript_26227/g.55616  ORF Transcript_26227/g.55616 Transcript_26227/m.55616 type:complete len:248 (-) Transcript_26227:1850-2593(-)